MEGIDRLTWKIVLQLCQDVYGTILRANLEKFHDVMDERECFVTLEIIFRNSDNPFSIHCVCLAVARGRDGCGRRIQRGSYGFQMWFRRGLRLRLNIGVFIHRNDADVLFHLSKKGVL